MKEKITPDFLTQLATALGDNWRYNQIMTNSRSYADYLFNRKGLVIKVHDCYGKKLIQWSLMYPVNKKNVDYDVFTTVGCSINKSIPAIAADLKNRLLSQSEAAYNEWQKRIEKEEKRKKAIEMDKYIIESIKKVIKLEPYYSNRYDYSFIIDTPTKKRIGELFKWSKNGDFFDLNLNKIPSKKVIEIIKLLEK